MARRFPDEQSMPLPPAGETDLARPQPAAATFGSTLVLSAMVVGAGLGLLAARTVQAAGAQEPSLAALLHGMVGIKALILLAVTVLVLLRLRGPADARSLGGYGVGLAASTGALVWLWGLSGLLWGAVFFYGGLALIYATATKDRGLAAGLGGRTERR